jgi:hypothetical protein
MFAGLRCVILRTDRVGKKCGHGWSRRNTAKVFVPAVRQYLQESPSFVQREIELLLVYRFTVWFAFSPQEIAARLREPERNVPFQLS